MSEPTNHESGTWSSTGFMCSTEFECHLGSDRKGAVIFPSEKALRAERRCADECGIVEVEVTVRRVVIDGTI